MINLSNIDRVPVSIIHPISDTICDASYAEYTFTEIGTNEKYLRWENGFDHLIFALGVSKGVVTRLVETIETGTTVAA